MIDRVNHLKNPAVTKGFGRVKSIGLIKEKRFVEEGHGLSKWSQMPTPFSVRAVTVRHASHDKLLRWLAPYERDVSDTPYDSCDLTRDDIRRLIAHTHANLHPGPGKIVDPREMFENIWSSLSSQVPGGLSKEGMLDAMIDPTYAHRDESTVTNLGWAYSEGRDGRLTKLGGGSMLNPAAGKDWAEEIVSAVLDDYAEDALKKHFFISKSKSVLLRRRKESQLIEDMSSSATNLSHQCITAMKHELDSCMFLWPMNAKDPLTGESVFYEVSHAGYTRVCSMD
jgi:hypothetical protein